MQMNKTDFFLIAAAFIPIVALSWSFAKDFDKIVAALKLSELKLTARRPLTAREEQMFFALTGALPECVVLAQVAFSAILTTGNRAERNRFDRKVADYLICSRQLTPIAVVELDDRSHRTKRDADAERDAMLQNAGYQTIRYDNIPSADQIQLDIENALKKLTSS